MLSHGRRCPDALQGDGKSPIDRCRNGRCRWRDGKRACLPDWALQIPGFSGSDDQCTFSGGPVRFAACALSPSGRAGGAGSGGLRDTGGKLFPPSKPFGLYERPRAPGLPDESEHYRPMSPATTSGPIYESRRAAALYSSPPPTGGINLLSRQLNGCVRGSCG